MGVKKEGKEVKEGNIFTLGGVTPDVVLVDGRASILNLRNYVTSIKLSTLSVALFNARIEVGRDAGV